MGIQLSSPTGGARPLSQLQGETQGPHTPSLGGGREQDLACRIRTPSHPPLLAGPGPSLKSIHPQSAFQVGSCSGDHPWVWPPRDLLMEVTSPLL